MAAVATVKPAGAPAQAPLRAWFQREVQPFLAEHAGAVERMGKRGLYPVGVLLLAFLAAVFLAMVERFSAALACAGIGILSIAVIQVSGPLYQAGGAAFRTLFKQRVVASLVARVLPGSTYDPDLAIARSVVLASGLVDDDVSYDGDDLVRGTIGRTPFALGDVRAGLSRRGQLRNDFHGLLFHAEFNRALSGRTLVLARGQAPQAVAVNRGLRPVTLESPAFEAAFSTYASDPVEARYVLTPATMENLVALARTVGRPLSAAFDRQRVYVALDNGQGAFEALAYAGEKAWADVCGYAALLDCARAIVTDLELNTRIWTKGFAPEAEAQAAAAVQPSAWSRVTAMGAWAFQRDPTLPFSPDDRPVAPSRTRIRRAGGRLRARFADPFLVRLLVLLALGAFLLALDPAWWAAHPALEIFGFLAGAARDVIRPAAVIEAALLLGVLYRTWSRVRWVEAAPGMVRVGRWGLPRRLPRERIRRVFAAEDCVMALVERSWTPVALSPRLGSHGAALWLAAEIAAALSGAPR